MKHLLFSLLLTTSIARAQTSHLMITGIMDGPLSGGQPKLIELYARDDISDLSAYALGTAYNGQGSEGPEFQFPPIRLERGTFLYITSSGQGFENFFGFRPDYVHSFVDMDGNDAVELFRLGERVDVYGHANTNGSGTAWDYTDGWAYRRRAEGYDAFFAAGQWTFSGPNALDGQSNNATALEPFPIGSYSQISMDGQLDASGVYGVPLCVQNNPTGFGDNSQSDPALANGSELNAAYAVIDGTQLCILLTGNLQSDFTKLELFIDAIPGGQNRLQGNNPDVDFNGLNRMGNDGSNNGMRFDNTFEADFFLTISGGNNPYELYANMARVNGQGGFGEFLGGGVGTYHVLNNGAILAIDNRNTGGVTIEQVSQAASVQTGLELSIPLESIDQPQGDIKLTAMLNGTFHDYVSNQVLCGLGGGYGNLGEPRDIDFNTIPGNQFFGLCSGVDGGIITFEDGSLEAFTCEGDGLSDVYSFKQTSKSLAAYTYVITDEQNRIVQFTPTPSFEFEGTGIGRYRVWGASYLGTLTATIGSNLSTVNISDDCYEVSTNFLTVTKDVAEGGLVRTRDGRTALSTCRSDGQADLLYFEQTGASSVKYTYLLTDSRNRLMAQAQGAEPEAYFDFEFASADTTHVWGLSYTGRLQLPFGSDITQASLADGCYDLSNNFIQVVSDEVQGGSLQFELGGTAASICVDQVPDPLAFTHSSSSVHPYKFLITDAANTILATAEEGSFDFESLSVDRCRVWGVSYHGQFTALLGDVATTAALASDCYELSANYLSIDRLATEGGLLSFQGGGESLETCPEDSTRQQVYLQHTGTADASYAYVQVDAQGVVLQVTEQDSVDVSESGEGEMKFWGISFTGNLNVPVGEPFSPQNLSDACFDLSLNSLSLTRTLPNGGTVRTQEGADSLLTCTGDGQADLLLMQREGHAGPHYRYVLTDTSNRILQMLPGSSLNLEGRPSDTLRMWGVAFFGAWQGKLGIGLDTARLADNCYALSDNYVRLLITEDQNCLTTALGAGASHSSWEIHPNPFANTLFIRPPASVATYRVRAFDLQGKIVWEATVPATRRQLEVPPFPPGLYTFVFVSEQGKHALRKLLRGTR